MSVCQEPHCIFHRHTMIRAGIVRHTNHKLEEACVFARELVPLLWS